MVPSSYDIVQKEDTFEEHWRNVTDKHTTIVVRMVELLSKTIFLSFFVYICIFPNLLTLFIDKKKIVNIH